MPLYDHDMSWTSVRTKLLYNHTVQTDMSKFLQQLSDTAKQGLTISVIGDPGSGKSTLVNNLLGVEVYPEDYCESPHIPGLTVTTFKRDILWAMNLIALFLFRPTCSIESPSAHNIWSLFNCTSWHPG